MTTKTGNEFSSKGLKAAPANGETVTMILGGREYEVTGRDTASRLPYILTGKRGATYGVMTHLEQRYTAQGFTTAFAVNTFRASGAPANLERLVIVHGEDGRDYLGSW